MTLTDAVVASLVFRLFIALGIGALVGLEREKSESAGFFAGSRTLPLVALLGALLNEFFTALLVPGFVALGLVVAVAYVGKVLEHDDIGTTTAVATLLTFVYGAMTTQSDESLVLAVVLGIVTTSLLAAKPWMHEFAEGIEDEELTDMLKFLLVAPVALLLLPNREMDALMGLNPSFVWLMVVFVSGISLGAYLLTKYVGHRRGVALSGVLGGMASSTATAVSLSSRAKTENVYTGVYAFAISIASMAMFPRVLIEVAVVSPSLLPKVAVPVTAMTLVGVVLAFVVFTRDGEEETVDMEPSNPFRLRPALVFGVFFGVVLLVSREGAGSFGDTGVYATAFFSGLADVDAITLSLGRLSAEGEISATTATTGIVIGAVMNTLVKFGIAAFFGGRELGRKVGFVLVTTAATGPVVVVAMSLLT
ncbi:MAG: MgtC/SapB family protein [Halobacteriales archaeon]|nr:MgtC/SapB family protein [Halobacteriales archaeon]